MKIAYICFWNAYRRDGVTKKMETQARHWRKAGHTVETFCLTSPPAEPGPPLFAAQTFEFTHLPGRLLATHRLAKAVRAFEPDVIYLRNDLFLPTLWPVLTKFPVVMEMNGSPQEYVLRNTRARAYYLWSHARLLDRVDGFVAVGKQIGEEPLLVARGRPIVIISNSIELTDFPETPAPNNERPRGVFLGGGGLVWHGVDKIRLMAEQLGEMDFHVIGPPAEDVGTDLPANLTVHGFLGRDEYEEIVTHCDFAIGTLALHRTNLDETSPLKLREYLAYGLPIVLGHSDLDLTSEPSWFILRLPNIESNVLDGIETIRAWVRSIVGRRVPRDEAQILVGADTKEAQRLAFITQIIAETATRRSQA